MKRFVTPFLVWGALVLIHLTAMADETPRYEGNIVLITSSMSIQDAVDVAQPGDIITLAPGTYYESVVVDRSGTSEAPIVITAQIPGSATISGATAPEYDLGLTHVQGDLYSAEVSWHVRWVMADGRNLMSYNDLAGLTSFTIPGHDSNSIVDGPPEGFVWEDGTLYLRLLDGQNATEADIEIHRSFPNSSRTARSWLLAMIKVGTASTGSRLLS